jgi:ABC-type polar amino acid transport system ATPase subunit
MGTVVDLQGLHIGWGRRRVFSGLELEIVAGSKLAVVGPGGSGKSTLLRVLEALVRDPGARAIDDGPWWSGRVRVAVSTCVRMPQHGRYDTRSFAELLAELGASIEPWIDDLGICKALVRSLHLPLFAAPEPTRRLASVILTAATDASLLLFDEPAFGLPDSWIRELGGLLARLGRGQRPGCCCVFVTHNLAFVRAVADRVALFVDGELIELAETSDFFERPRHPRTRTFLQWGA